MTTEAAEQSLPAVISLARYGEAFAYDADGQMFSLENPACVRLSADCRLD